MAVKIIGTGSCLPEMKVTNNDLAGIMDTSDEWIRSRTGIRERRLAKEETTAGMAAAAAQTALENSGVSSEEVDLIIVGTITGDNITPSAACLVQAKLGARRAVAFDINGACSGFLFALHTAYAYLQAGIYKTALVAGAETLSKIMDWTDRSTCVLFGDGAGAALLRREEGTGGILGFEQCSNGAGGDVLTCPGRGNHNPFYDAGRELGYVRMDGQEVYKFAVTKVPKTIQNVMEQAGLEEKDIRYFVLHQANIRIIQSVAKRLRAQESKFPTNLEHCGNISAGSVPILLDQMNQKGMLSKGDKIILSGFGAGLTWACAAVEW